MHIIKTMAALLLMSYLLRILFHIILAPEIRFGPALSVRQPTTHNHGKLFCRRRNSFLSSRLSLTDLYMYVVIASVVHIPWSDIFTKMQF